MCPFHVASLYLHLIYIFELMYSNCILPFQMLPIYTGPQAGPPGPSRGAGPSRPSRGAGRGESSRGRGRRRAHIIEEEPSKEEEEAADPQSETSADREGGSDPGSGSGDEAEEGSEDGSPDSDDGDDGVESVLQKRTKRASHSCSREH